MANRKTIEEANDLKAGFQARYPGTEFRIVAREIDQPWGCYDVLEARQCTRCGGEYLTAGIGEWDNGLCTDCQKKARQEIDAESQRTQAENRASAAQQRFYDKHMI